MARSSIVVCPSTDLGANAPAHTKQESSGCVSWSNRATVGPEIPATRLCCVALSAIPARRDVMPFQPTNDSDWKLLRRLHAVARERFCGRVTAETEQVIADRSRTPYERYMAIFAVVARRDHEMARIFDDLRRSTVVTHLAAMRSQGLLTDEEWLQLSRETRAVVDQLLKT